MAAPNIPWRHIIETRGPDGALLLLEPMLEALLETLHKTFNANGEYIDDPENPAP